MSSNGLLCHHDQETQLQEPAHLWFGLESPTPCIHVSPRVGVEKGVVQLDKDRKAWCQGVEDNDIGSRVIVLIWGGKDDNRIVMDAAVVVDGGMAMLHGEEEKQRINDAGYAVSNISEERAEFN